MCTTLQVGAADDANSTDSIDNIDNIDRDSASRAIKIDSAFREINAALQDLPTVVALLHRHSPDSQLVCDVG